MYDIFYTDFQANLSYRSCLTKKRKEKKSEEGVGEEDKREEGEGKKREKRGGEEEKREEGGGEFSSRNPSMSLTAVANEVE